MMIPLLIGAGGAAGSIVRYYFSSFIARIWPSEFPAPILVVNIAGSLALGLIIGWLAKQPGDHNTARLLLAIGFCGGFTTFSTFSMEAWGLVTTGRMGAAAVYVICSVLFSLLAFGGGLWMMRGL